MSYFWIRFCDWNINRFSIASTQQISHSWQWFVWLSSRFATSTCCARGFGYIRELMDRPMWIDQNVTKIGTTQAQMRLDNLHNSIRCWTMDIYGKMSINERISSTELISTTNSNSSIEEDVCGLRKKKHTHLICCCVVVGTMFVHFDRISQNPTNHHIPIFHNYISDEINKCLIALQLYIRCYRQPSILH